jgi:hypothetical protein
MTIGNLPVHAYSKNFPIPEGSILINPVKTTTYVMHIWGPNRSWKTCEATVVVKESSRADPPFCALGSAPETIYREKGTTLWWWTSGVTKASITNLNRNIILPEDDTWINPTETTTYVMNAEGPGGKTTCKTTVVVEENPNPDPPRCWMGTMSSTMKYKPGIWWATEGATSASISHLDKIITLPQGSAYPDPTETTTYVLNVEGPGGQTTCEATVVVEERPPFCSLGSAPQTIYKGEGTTLWWWTARATKATISNVDKNILLPENDTWVSPTETTTYVMNAEGPGGKTTCEATVVVEERPPFCSLGSAPQTIYKGEGTTLWWWTARATKATISNVDKNILLPENDTWVSPTETTTYVMNAEGPGGKTTCEATVVVEDSETGS